MDHPSLLYTLVLIVYNITLLNALSSGLQMLYTIHCFNKVGQFVQSSGQSHKKVHSCITWFVLFILD
jgi:hypothetical protein